MNVKRNPQKIHNSYYTSKKYQYWP